MSKPSKNIGIRRKVSGLRDAYVKRVKPKTKYPPSKPRHPETSGNRYGK